MKALINFIPDEGWLAEIDYNQCDGCLRGLPLVEGIYHKASLPWDRMIQGCTKNRYPLPESKLENSEKTAREWVESKVGKQLFWEVQYPGRTWTGLLQATL
jgi:hypothetical protein